ncbi:MAG: hypothetical protein H8F28_14610 [Fibrella sp.]|nr:hypothetical protein [Armatimonadota bacterium]
MTDISLIPRDRFVEFADTLEKDERLRENWTTEQLREINRIAEVERARKDRMAQILHDLNGVKDGESSADVLKVRDLTYPLDAIASKARHATSEFYKEELKKLAPEKRIEKRGITAVVAKVTKRLNARGLDDIERTLLALPAVYEFLLISALDDQKVKDDDDQGLFDAVLRSVITKPRRYLLNEILGNVLDAQNIKLEKDELIALRDLAFGRGVALRVGTVRDDVLKLIGDGQHMGTLRLYVDRYAQGGEIDEALFTEGVRREMARYLYARGVRIKDKQGFDGGKYDEHFALAYDHATRVAQGNDDPVDVARTKGGVSDWDFTIRRISQSERPIVRAQAIRAAGALYTTFVEGEQMHVFDIADSLLTEWHRGELDIPDGETASLLNRYEILMRDRPTEEERQMHYKRVFNIGEAEMLSGTVVNEAFPGLWDNLMYEVTRYIDKTERYYTEEKMISRTAMYQAIQDLQYNLSEYMTGSAPKKTTEMYRSLEEALDIIGSEDVLNHMGGRRKTITAVIERMGRTSLGVAIPATSLVTVAERGNDIFHFIADFAPENVADDEFQRFLDACKACIVSQAALEPRGEETEYTDAPPSDRYENGSDYGNGGRSSNGYAGAGRNGYKNGNGSSNGNGSRRMAGVGGRSSNGGGGGNFDDWDS